MTLANVEGYRCFIGDRKTFFSIAFIHQDMLVFYDGSLIISCCKYQVLPTCVFFFSKQEYEFLYYSLSSARIFFRADLTAAEEKEASTSGKEKI